MGPMIPEAADPSDVRGSRSRAGRLPGEVLIVFAAIAWGSAYPAATLVLTHLAPIGSGAWRGAISTLALIAILAARRELSSLRIEREQWAPLVVLGLLGGTVFVAGLNLSIVASGSSVTAFLVGSFPVVMVLTAPIVLGERLTPRALAAAALAVFGTLLLTRPGTNIEPLAVLTALAASIGFAFYLQLTRRWSARYRLDSGAVAVAVMIGMAAGCAPLQLAIDPSGLVPGFTLGELVGFLWLALPSGGLAHIAANTAVRRMPAGRSSAFLFLVPLSGAVIAAVFLGERLDPGQLTGGALIVLAIVVATVPAAWLLRRDAARRTYRR